jgi:hypothetical protein
MRSIQFLLFAILLFLASCQSFKTATLDPGTNTVFPRLEKGNKIKVFKVDGVTQFLIFDRIEGGAIVGKVYKQTNGEPVAEGMESSVSFSEISKMEVRKVSLGKTLLIPGGIVLGLFVMYVLAFGGAFQ